MSDTPAPAPTPAGRSATAADQGRKIWRSLRDPRFTRLQRWSFVISLLLVFFAVSRIPGMTWSDRIQHGWYHLFVVGWFLLLTYKLRTIGTREIVRFWVTGFFPVALVTYILAEPLERLIGTGNFQTAFWVPFVEEVVKVLPLFLWTTVLRPNHRHGTLSDFWILGFALGAGFSFHEDALYDRLVASGFAEGFTGQLFPIFLQGSQFVITHAGWTALAGVGVGVFALYRTRPWAWIVALAFLAVPIVDHAAVNWRGGGADLVRTLVANGRLGSGLLVLSVVIVVAHDWYILKWASDRDNLFPSPGIRADITAVSSGSVPARIAALMSRHRYRRFRNAAFSDLYRVRSRGDSAGDRSVTIAQLNWLAASAKAPTAATQRAG